MTLPPRVSDLIPFDLLLSVARLGSLGRAAAEHGMSQPAASARMRHLEGQLRLALVERSPRGSRLTPAGALVAGWAQAVVDAATALDAGVTALRREQESRLRVAASLTVAEYLLPAWLTALRSADAGPAVALTAVNSAEVAEAVLSGRADLGFVEGPDLPAGLRAVTVSPDALTVVIAPGHRASRHRPGNQGSRLRYPALLRAGTSGPGSADTGPAPGRAVLHYGDQVRGRRRRGPRGPQLAGRGQRTDCGHPARRARQRPRPAPYPARRLARRPPPHRPRPGPLPDRRPLGPPRLAG